MENCNLQHVGTLRYNDRPDRPRNIDWKKNIILRNYRSAKFREKAGNDPLLLFTDDSLLLSWQTTTCIFVSRYWNVLPRKMEEGKREWEKKKKKRMENRRKWENETSSVTKLACSPANLRYVTPRIVLREQITFVEFLLCHRIVCRFVCNVRAWLMYAHSTLISSTLGKLKMTGMNNYHFAFVFDCIFNSNE